MATAAVPEPAVAAPGPPAASGGRKLIMVGAVAGLVLGGVVGAFVIAPRVWHAGGDEAVVEGTKEREVPAGPSLVHEIENLVVNPANTNGARFLLVTTSIVVRDAAALEELVARDAEIRDRIVDFLSAQPIETLGDPSLREKLKTDLAASIGALFAEGVVKRVLLPQFVLQ